MKIGSLFTGVAGLEMGILMEESDAEVIWQAECDPHALAVLEHHFPLVQRFDDVRKINASVTRPDVICGGFPCQDVSLAGARAGLSGERSGLWWEFRRIVRTLRPRLVFIENVHGGRRGWLPTVRRSLWKVGYASLSLRVRACDAGAPHRRARCFLLAYAVREHQRNEPEWASRANGTRAAVAVDDGAAGIAADADGEPGNTRRSQPRRHFEAGRAEPGSPSPPWISRDANRGWQLQPGGSVGEQWRWTRHADGWAFEPPVPGVDDGTPGRVDRERLCGNAVVPQAAALAWRTLTACAAAQLTGEGAA